MLSGENISIIQHLIKLGTFVFKLGKAHGGTVRVEIHGAVMARLQRGVMQLRTTSPM